jgi:HD-GYP domain-containing protein (c-di-GMP phosphodiesterase class II)
MQDSTRTLLEGMADAVDLRDPYTGGHSRRVTEYCAQILRELRVTGCEADLILGAARVHDIGKIGVPDGILNKPSRLTPEEQAIMQSHSEMGAQLLARYPDFARGQDIVRHHHERWDGKGYPAGLKQMNIPFGARVIAVADSFDAMISDRPYRKGVSVQGACAILREERGRQWDPQVVDACLRALEQPLVEPASTASTDALRRAPVNAPASTFA